MTIISASVTSRTRVFPSSRNASTTKPLSIVDGSVLRYSPTSATWFFDAPSIGPVVDPETLSLSLSKALDNYPQLSGSLHMPIPNVVSDSVHHTQRFNRPQITWGNSRDPGVEFVVARSAHSLSPLLPTPAERVAAHRVWDASVIALLGLLPDHPKLALHDRVSSDGLPCMILQITIFACGGVAIAVKLAHPLADAQTLLTFVHDWAALHRGLAVPARHFNPELLDAMAEGDVDAPAPDSDIIARSRNVPLHRFDWWASSTPDCPSFMLPFTDPPPVVKQSKVNLDLGRPLPWKTWNIQSLVQYYIVHFTRSEILRIWKAATTADPGTAGHLKVSKLDALLAHIWTLIVRARNLTSDDSTMNLDVTIGLRPRMSPPLLDLLGSPLLNIPISQPASQVSIASAALIRSSMSRYDSSALGALLHEMAYEVDPSRRWNAFLGERHTIVTSWLETRPGMAAYDVDFGFGSKPRMVDPLMPECDGCVQIMESGLEAGSGHSTSWTPWYQTGASVSLHFGGDVMSNLLADPLLRKYDI